MRSAKAPTMRQVVIAANVPWNAMKVSSGRYTPLLNVAATDSGVNWEVTKDTARKTVASLGADPSPGFGQQHEISEAASIAEVVRAGALAVPEGQWHAALALGMTRRQAIAGAIFPQALRLAVPPLASQYMNLIKNSSLAVVIGYPDLVSIGNTSINQNGQALEVILIIMAVYLSAAKRAGAFEAL